MFRPGINFAAGLLNIKNQSIFSKQNVSRFGVAVWRSAGKQTTSGRLVLRFGRPRLSRIDEKSLTSECDNTK